MPRLSAERITELDKFAMRKNYELIWTGMLMGLLEVNPDFRLKRLVRIKKENN
jgi:hypothetical protein